VRKAHHSIRAMIRVQRCHDEKKGKPIELLGLPVVSKHGKPIDEIDKNATPITINTQSSLWT
jgi:hypothetical protein